MLGAGTTPRFALLLVVLTASSVQLMSGLIGNPFFPGIPGPHDQGIGCLLAAGVNPEGDVLPGYLATIRTSGPFEACEARYGWNPPWWWPYVAAALLFAVAAVIYWVLPAWKGRRSRVVDVRDLADGGELSTALSGLVAAAGLARAPRFVIDPAAATASAVVFGRFRRYTVCLQAGLVARRAAAPGAFRAVVLHELAHLRNHDVAITYATVALWRTYLIAALLPTVVSDCWQLLSGGLFGINSQSIFRPAAQVTSTREVVLSAFLVMLVYLARADILRHREIYADLDAAAWGADAGHWHTGPPGRPDRGRLARALAAFSELWRTHPDWERRRYALADSSAVFGTSSLQMFLTGAAALILTDQLSSDLSPFLPGGQLPEHASPWLVAGLVAAITGVALWRAVTHAVLTGRPPPSGLRAGLWLGAGMVAGQLMLSGTPFGRVLPSQPALLLLLVLTAAVAASWTADYAALSVRTWRGRSVRPAMLIGLAATWLLLGVTLAWWESQGTLYLAGFPISSPVITHYLVQRLPGPAIPGHSGTVAVITSVIPLAAAADGSLLAVVALLLWLLPLLSWARRRAAGSPRWLLQALPGPPRPEDSSAGLPRLRRMLLPGVAGGLLSWLGIAGVMAFLHSWHVPFREHFGTYLLMFIGWLGMAVLGGAVAAAIAAAALVRRYRVIAGLIAAGVATLLGVAGVFLFASSDGCAGPLTTMPLDCGWRPVAGWQAAKLLPVYVGGLGLFITATTALLAGLAAGLATRLRRGPRPAAPAGPAAAGRRGRAGLAARRGAIAVICAAALALTAAASGFPFAQGSSASPTLPVSELTSSITNPAPPTVRRVQISAWMNFGGKKILPLFPPYLQNLGNGASALSRVLSADPASPAARRAAAALSRACAAIGRPVQAAQRYFPIPDPREQRLWSAALSGILRGEAGCRQALRHQPMHQRDADRLVTALHQLSQAASTLLVLLNRIQAEVKALCVPCI